MPDTQKQIPHFTPPSRRVFPGVRGKTKKDIIASDGKIIPEGTEVIIQPLIDEKSSPPFPYRITTFKRDDAASHLPEGKRNIIPNESLEVLVENENDAFSFTEHYQATTSPLFSGRDAPRFEDITQKAIPDCFLLAVLQSILNAPDGKEYLRSIMKQNEDGTTTVRLFNPKTLTPEYIIVPNAILVDEDGNALNSHKALWVHVIENAYVAMQTKSANREEAGGVDESIGSIYSGGGYTATASRIMLGVNSESAKTGYHGAWHIPPNELKNINELKAMISGTKNSRMVWAEFLDNIGVSLGYTGDKDKIRADALEMYTKYFEFYKAIKPEFDKITSNFDKTGAEKIIALIDLAEDPDIQNFLKMQLNYEYMLTQENTVRGEMSAFRGRYSEKQTALYHQIEDELSQGNLITTCTSKALAMSVAGIAGGHAYSVHQVIEKIVEGVDSKTGDKKSIPVRYVQLRNPWGTYGRTYEQMDNDLKFIAKGTLDAGIFEVELSDFCKYFESISVTTDNEQRFKKEIRHQQLLEQVNEEYAGIDKSKNPSLQDLVNFKKNFKDHIFELELLRFNVNNPEIKLEFKKELLNTFKPGYKDNTFNDSAIECFAIALKRGMNIHYSDAMPYIKDDPEGQQLFRLYKLDFLEQKEDKTEKELNDISSLKEEIFNNARNEASEKYQQGLSKVQQCAALYKQQFESKFKEFDILAADVNKLLTSTGADVQLFDAYIKLNAKFIELDVMHQSLTELDTDSSNACFDIAKEAMRNSKDTVTKIEEYKTYLAKNEIATVNLLHEASECTKKGQINTEQNAVIGQLANSSNPTINDMHHLVTNNKLPGILDSLVASLYKAKHAISNLAISIKAEIRHSLSLLRGQNYMLENNADFDKQTLGSHKNEADNNPKMDQGTTKSNISFYKRMLDAAHSKPGQEPNECNPPGSSERKTR